MGCAESLLRHDSHALMDFDYPFPVPKLISTPAILFLAISRYSVPHWMFLAASVISSCSKWISGGVHLLTISTAPFVICMSPVADDAVFLTKGSNPDSFHIKQITNSLEKSVDLLFSLTSFFISSYVTFSSGCWLIRQESGCLAMYFRFELAKGTMLQRVGHPR